MKIGRNERPAAAENVAALSGRRGAGFPGTDHDVRLPTVDWIGWLSHGSG